MNIRARLSLRFTMIVATLGVIFSISIYYFSASYRRHEFYQRLEEKAFNYAQLLIKLDAVNPNLMEVIDRNTAYLPNERIVVLDHNNRQLFNTYNHPDPVDAALIERARGKKELRYIENENEVLAIAYPNAGKDLVVIVSALDREGLGKLDNLKLVLALGLAVFILATMVLGWFFSRQMLSPISNVIGEVEKISVSNLTRRVDEGNGQDEIAQLAITFNNMLDRIQKAFELQRSFVSNSSHELRTPLTAITGQLEVALMNTRRPEEYQAVLSSLLEDIKSLNRLSNGLLELAQADLDISRLHMKIVRLDELLWSSRNDLLRRNPSYAILIEIRDFPEDEKLLQVLGSEQLLRSLFINLMDNACKFSPDKQVQVVFSANNQKIHISFSDKGIGIPAGEMDRIGQPFYRAFNAKAIKGHGLGLSLAFKICDVHRAHITISSQPGQFTRADLVFDTTNGQPV